MIIFNKKKIEKVFDNIRKYRFFCILAILTIQILVSSVQTIEAQKSNNLQLISVFPETQVIQSHQKITSSINHFGNIYAPLQKNGNLSSVLADDSLSDPRTEYDTPNPEDPANIARFRVKTIAESDAQIKQRLIDNDVYSQIQNYKSQGETVYVSTPNEFVGALWGLDRPYDWTLPSVSNSNPYLRRPLKNISRIVLTKDISIRQYQPLRGYQDFGDMRAVTLGNIPDRNIVIDGKDPNTGVIHRIDMCNSIYGNAGFADTRISLENNFSSVFVMNNVNLSGVDYYGPVSAFVSTAPKQIIYRNITYVGAQLAASYSTNVTFTGKNKVNCATEYQSLEPYDTGAKNSKGNSIYDARPGATYYAEGNVPSNLALQGRVSNYFSEQIMECANVTFAYNSLLDGYSATTAPFRLGFRVDGGIVPKVDVMDRAQINLESTNKGPRDEMGETGMIQLQTGTIELHPHSSVVLNAHDYVPNPSNGDVGNGNKPNYSSRDLIGLYGAGAVLKIDDYASIKGVQNGRVAVNVPGSVYLGSGASLFVGKWGKISVKSINAGNSNKPLLKMGDLAKINVDQPGTFDLQGDGEYNGNRSLIDLGVNSTFQFNRARMVNIQYNGTQKNTNLLSMYAGKMNVKNMDIYAWKFGNSAAIGTHPDAFDNIEDNNYMWPSVFNFDANYNAAGFMNLSSATSTLYPNDLVSMKANYNTNNFQRVMFRYIPTVYIKFTSQPVDDPSDINSYKLNGETYTDNISDPEGDYLPLANTYVRLKGHVKNTRSSSEVGSVDLDQPFNNSISPDSRWAPGLSTPEVDLNSNFSAISDSQGKFSVTLPNNPTQKTFMASDLTDSSNSKPLENGRIQAFAFKSGNYNTANIPVLDKTKPIAQSTPMRYTVVDRPALDPKGFVDTGINSSTGLRKITDLHPEINSNSYTKLSDYKFEFGSQNLATDTSFWTTPGIKDVYINVIDPSGNIAVVKGKVTISATPVFIEINKPHAVLKLPSGSATWTDAQWKSWVTTNNPNQARAIKINTDGTITDISNQMTNDAHGFLQQANNVIYSVPTGAVPPNPSSVTSSAKIEFRSDTIQLKLPLDSSNQPKSIDFGRHGSYQTGHLNSNGTTSYPSLVVDDRVDKSYNWHLEVNAGNFEDQTVNSGGSLLPKSSMDLGLLDHNSNFFTDIIGTNVTITEGINDKNFDIMNGLGLTNPNQKLAINRVGADGRLNGRRYKSKLVWTLVDDTP